MTTSDLARSASAIIAGGVARVFFSPQRHGQTWTITRIVTTATSGPNTTCQLRLYRNVESDNAALDATLTGGQDTSETNISLGTLDQLIAVWRSSTANPVPDGTVCTLVIYGTLEDGRNGF